MKTWIKAHKIVTIVLLLIVLGLIGAAAHNSQKTPEVTAVTPAADNGNGSASFTLPSDTPAPTPAGPATSAGNGTYQVGVDLRAGEYKTPGGTTAPGCYWERSSNDSGESSAIIANDVNTGPMSVTVNDGEFVTFKGGCTWTLQTN